MIGDPAQASDTRRLSLLALSATAGVLLEFYDFTIFGYAAAGAFPAVFFPNLSASRALVFSYIAYASGYPARLVGAFIFGHFGDRSGRKAAFLVNIFVVGISTCLTGLLPGYATLGVVAPILLVALRVVQGIGLGGEFGGASALLAEFAADRPHRAFWISLANLGLALGLMAGSAVFLLLRTSFATTGWRVAMWLSAVIAIPALVARAKICDSPLFERLKARRQLARMPSIDVFRTHAVPITLLSIVFAFQLMDAVVTGTYIISFMQFAGIALDSIAIIVFTSRIADVLGVLLSGPIADLLSRRNVGRFAIALTTLLSYPFAVAIIERRTVLAGVIQFAMVMCGMGVLHGLAPILYSETFPTRVRYSGAGLSFNIAGVLGGMIAPPLLAALIGTDVLRGWYYIPVVYAIYAAMALFALQFVRETRGVRLEDLDVSLSVVANR